VASCIAVSGGGNETRRGNGGEAAADFLRPLHAFPLERVARAERDVEGTQDALRKDDIGAENTSPQSEDDETARSCHFTKDSSRVYRQFALRVQQWYCTAQLTGAAIIPPRPRPPSGAGWGRVWTVDRTHALQATHEETSWTGRLRSPRADQWWRVWACPDHLDGLTGRR
jgi:hypothetical protein